MTMADLAPEDAPAGAPPERSGAPRASPGLAAGWLLRIAAFAAAGAGAMGIVVAPGIRGNAGEKIVDWVDRGSATASFFLLLALLGLVGWGAVELVRDRDAEAAPRFVLVAGAAGVVPLIVIGVALHDRVSLFAERFAVVTGAGAAACALAGAYVAARRPHTRAIAGILVALAFASIARFGAWELARTASERADVQFYSLSRGLATAGVLLEAAAQLLAVMWLGTRSRVAGQLGASAAVVAAFVVTWGVAKGVHSGAAPWQSVLHTALADAPGVPPPYWFDALATFLVPASILLALVSAAQPTQVAVVVSTVALALVSRGAFDAPLRALCAVTAAQWAALASRDDRAMWRTLMDDRERRLAEDAPP